MLNATQSLKSGLALNPATVNADGVLAGLSIDLIDMVGGEGILSFLVFSGARTGGDFTVQDVQMSKVSDFSSDVITINSTLIQHFVPQAANGLLQTKIDAANTIKKIGVHLTQSEADYRYARLRLIGENGAHMLIGAIYQYLPVKQPI